MSDNSSDGTPIRRKRWRIAAYAAAAVIVTLGAGVALLPTVATWQIETQLEKLGAKSVQVGSLSINPATGEIWVERFKSIGPDGEDIVVGAAKLRIGLAALATRNISISELSVADADIDIRQDAKGVWSVGGFPMVFASANTPAEPSAPWQLEADNIAIDNSRMTLNIVSSLQKVLVEKLRIDRLSTRAPTEPSTISLSVAAGGGKVAIDGKAFPFAPQPGVELSINVAALKLDAFGDLIATGQIKEIAGVAAINGTAKAGFRDSGGATVSFSGKASLSDSRVLSTQYSTSAQSLSWNGSGSISSEGNAVFSATLTGDLEAKALGSTLKQAGIDRLAAGSVRVGFKDAGLKVTPQDGMSGNLTGALDLTGLTLEAPQLGGTVAAGTIKSADNRISFGQTESGALKLSLEGGLSVADVSAQSTDNSVRAAQRSAEWTGSVIIEPAPDEPSAGGLSISGEAKLAGFDATVAGTAPYRIQMESAVAKGIAISPDARSVASATIGGLSAAGTSDNSPLPQLGLKSLRAAGIAGGIDGRLGIKSLRAGGLTGRIVRDADGAIAMPSLAVTRADGEPAPRKSASQQVEASTIRIDSAVISDGKFTFVDNAVDPPFSIETSRLQASLSEFDTAKPDSDAPLNILLGLGKFGRLQVDGAVKPDLAMPNANLGIGFKNIELFKFNGYIRPAIKHNIRQGRADGDIDFKLSDDQINAATALTVSRLKVSPAPDAKGGNKGDTGPPIETALGLIQDDKGIIKLSIPVTGSLSDPKFDISDAIGQAIGGAMQKTLLTAVKIAFPLGAVVAIVDSVGAPKIEVKPLVFAPGSATLTPDLKSRIAEIAAYLKKRPKEAPSICGPANAADLAVLRKATPKANRKSAINLAAARITAVRDQLVSTHAIPVKRLFVCAPEFVETAGMVPSVTVDLKS